MPVKDFTAADYLLYLKSQLQPDNGELTYRHWRPSSAVYMKGPPAFLLAAEHKSTADEILKILKLESAEQFKALFRERASLQNEFRSPVWFDPIHPETVARFGIR